LARGLAAGAGTLAKLEEMVDLERPKARTAEGRRHMDATAATTDSIESFNATFQSQGRRSGGQTNPHRMASLAQARSLDHSVRSRVPATEETFKQAKLLARPFQVMRECHKERWEADQERIAMKLLLQLKRIPVATLRQLGLGLGGEAGDLASSTTLEALRPQLVPLAVAHRPMMEELAETWGTDGWTTRSKEQLGNLSLARLQQVAERLGVSVEPPHTRPSFVKGLGSFLGFQWFTLREARKEGSAAAFEAWLRNLKAAD